MSEIERVLYVKEGCPHCAGLAGELKRRGADFKEIDVSKDRAALREIKQKYRAKQVPVLVEGEKVTIGYKGNG